MKKVLILLVIATVILWGLSASARLGDGIQPSFQTAIVQEPASSIVPRDYTHTVFVEVGTRTTCPSCPASNTAWHSIYGSGNYDFEYTELVYDKNPVASSRFNQFNPKWVPTSYWDGGEYVYPGTNTGTFYTYLGSSGARTVPDLVAELNATWLGGAAIEISYSIMNNEAGNYPGRLRIYVVELVSTLWNDYNGNPYYHAFLDFAVNAVIDIPAGDSITDIVTWDGAAAGYPGITKNNVQVILALFGDTPHQSYSDPPTGNPFTAYYSDECIAVLLGGENTPPEKPSLTGTTNGKVGTSYEYSFVSSDPDGDDVFYCVNWSDDTGEVCIGPFASGEEVSVNHTWSEKGTYIVKVKATDVYGADSEWATLEVSMPHTRGLFTVFPGLKWLWERFPSMFPILRQVVGY